MSAKVIWEPSGVICKCAGVVTRQHLMKAAFNAFYEDERNTQVSYQIFDAFDADDLKLNQSDILLLASTAIGRSRQVPNIKAAIIAPNPKVRKVVEQYVAYFERVSHTWTFLYFDVRQPAYDWARLNARAPIRDHTV
ncbi:MAG: hypothetical protein ACPGES_06395 [Coraliomargarita sp.]